MFLHRRSCWLTGSARLVAAPLTDIGVKENEPSDGCGVALPAALVLRMALMLRLDK